MSDASIQMAAWRLLCRHSDGIAVGGMAEALEDGGVLRMLSEATAPIDVEMLARDGGAAPGFLMVALRVLADQGFARLKAQGGGFAVMPTEIGRDWIATAKAYRGYRARIEAASAVAELFDGKQPLVPLSAETVASIPVVGLLDNADLGQRIRSHLAGPVAAALAVEIWRRGLSAAFLSREGVDVTTPSLTGLSGETEKLLLKTLVDEGLAVETPRGVRATTVGAVWIEMAPQYLYAVCHLAIAAVAGGQIFSSTSAPAKVDRSMDIQFSGLVFEKTCRPVFGKMLVEAFSADGRPPPAAIVDTGCGDGSLLLAARRILRESRPSVPPPILVGFDVAPESVERTSLRLSAEGLEGFAAFGDVGDPSAIAATLSDRGIDPLDVLHVSKSVIHNRSFAAGAGPFTTVGDFPSAEGVYLDQAGRLMLPIDVANDLAAHFALWRRWTGRHGMLVIEAHLTPSATVAAAEGGCLSTMLHAFHSLTRQMLVDARLFLSAAQAGGFTVAASRALAAVNGWPTLTATRLR